ncbi:hypothetical protein H072_10133 [Dactylellina haptotyla CBS 200.50]|uniref:SMP-30/Gluconolactonase/LRE-like region domain-containing protein n=1 Tax=Dactylellina haptotyla (strain CBS 200.50) TaxID=1284197 RepID=S8A0Z0_DACHA|nr:hypothetical protein H072_10133 [Dactylellina haptotyla CBS 200.50]
MRLKLFSLLFAGCSTLISYVHASPLDQATPVRSLKPYHTVYQFPGTAWIESIAVRWNGDLLVTLVDRPELYLIDPQSRRPPILLYTFPHVTALLGIDEVGPDEFAVVAGNWSIPTFSTTPGSYSIWTATFKSPHSNAVRLRRAAPIPEANFLNGVATLDPAAGLILVGDAGAGLVYRVNVHTGAYTVVLQDDASMGTYPVGSTHSGINGVKVHDGYAYYTNTARGLFSRVRINTRTGTATGPYQILTSPGAMDDFAFAPKKERPGHHSGEDWVVYSTGHANNILLKITPDGQFSTVFGSPNSTVLEGDTACAFGRTKRDSDVLYVVTDGGLAHPLDGFVQGGEVIAISVDKL